MKHDDSKRSPRQKAIDDFKASADCLARSHDAFQRVEDLEKEFRKNPEAAKRRLAILEIRAKTTPDELSRDDWNEVAALTSALMTPEQKAEEEARTKRMLARLAREIPEMFDGPTRH